MVSAGVVGLMAGMMVLVAAAVLKEKAVMVEGVEVGRRRKGGR